MLRTPHSFYKERKRTQRIFSSFIKNKKEHKERKRTQDCFVLLKRMQKNARTLRSFEKNRCPTLIKYHILKGTVQRDFRPPFFPSFEPAWATDQWVKIFLILVKFSPSYSNFYESPRGMILRRVNLPGVSYPGESNDFSRSYLKGQSNKIFDLLFS